MRFHFWWHGIISMVVPMTLCTPTGANAGAQALSSDEALVKIHVDRGLHFIEQENHGAALEEFMAAEKITPRVELEYNIAVAFRKMGNHTEALRWLERSSANSNGLTAKEKSLVLVWIEEEGDLVGTLLVSSNVAGASILIAGEPVSKTPMSTPLRLDKGAHFIGVYMEGYVPQIRRVVVAGDSLAQEHFDLAPTSEEMADLLITSGLPDVDILVDDLIQGRTPMRGPLVLKAGTHELEFRRPGYHPLRRRVTLNSKSQLVEDVKLKENTDWVTAYGGYLKLDFRGQQTAHFTVDGLPRGTYEDSLRLPPGMHRLRVERPGFGAVERDIQVFPRQTTTEVIELDPNPDVLAQLRADYASRQKIGNAGMIAGGVATGLVVLGAVLLTSVCLPAGDGNPDTTYTWGCKDPMPIYTALLTSMGSVGVTTMVLSHRFATALPDPRRYDMNARERGVASPWLVPIVQPIEGGAILKVAGTF